MKYYIDTEFIEYPCTIDLISIGIKCEDGRTLYMISSEYKYKKASDWVKKNVIVPAYLETVTGDQRNHFTPDTFHKFFGNRLSTIKKSILKFVGKDKPEFWGFYADYDWVVFCWLFGSMINLPEGWPMYCRDLKQLQDEHGFGSIPDPEGEHNALVDACWNEDLHNYYLSKM